MNLDHLDDPQGFAPDDEFRAAAHREGRRRRTRRRLALATGSVLTSMAVLVAALAGYGLWRTSQIDRVDVEFAAPPVSLDEPFNVLLIGSDSRARTSDADLVAGTRSDTMIVVRVVPAERRLVLLSLPRDLVLDPADGAAGRLNARFADGGASLLVQTVETELGIPLSGYVEVDFDGFVELVDAEGGLPLRVTETVRDRATGLQLDPAECAVIDGRTALALTRSRHLETLSPSGRWVEDPTSDFGRTLRQRTFLEIAAARIPELAGSVGGARSLVEVAADHLTIDGRLDITTLVALGSWVVSGPQPVVDSEVLPGVGTMIDSASVLVLGAGAASAVEAVGGTLPTTTAASAATLAPGPPSTITEPVSVVPFGPCP